ncbi:MAG: transposase [Bacteroidales bacterium]|nr:transposase [Bacteroidales bacterium]
MTGEVHQGIYPPGVLHNFQYGTNIKAAAIALVLQGVMSRERVHQFLGSLLQVPISAGTIDNWFQEFAEDPLLKLAMERLDSDLLAAPFNGFDETYMWVNGILSFGHIACTPEITRVHFSRSKGKKGMEEGDYIQFYDGIALHDRNNTYFLFKFKHHVLCVAHLLRELEGVYEDDPKQTWAKRLSLLLKRYIEKRNLAIEAGQLRFYAPTLKSLRRDFTRLLREGDKQAPPLAKKEAGKKGKPKNDRGRNALEHLKKCIEYYLLPYTDFRLPVTNNVSEGGFRMIKVREKIGPCRTERGATNFCRAFSYISTAGKRGVSAVDAIRLALEGTPEKALWPKGEPPPLPQKEARDGTG